MHEAAITLRKRLTRILFKYSNLFIDLQRLALLRELPAFWRARRQYLKLRAPGAPPVETRVCLGDATSSTPLDAHYFYQEAWLVRQLITLRPDRHVDVGSSLGTVAAISAIAPTVFVDYRPTRVSLEGLASVCGDIRALPFRSASQASVSSLHVVEHVGLGRYGDSLDADGSICALAELARIVAPGGHLFLSAPVGRPREVFNAHRVFSYRMLMGPLHGFALVSLALVDDGGVFHRRASESQVDTQIYGCALLALRKDA
jgi:SAM-dependent methyltransferase